MEYVQSEDRPSIVVIGLPAAWESCVRQERAGLLAMWTVQAPQRPMPQPYFVPCRLSVVTEDPEERSIRVDVYRLGDVIDGQLQGHGIAPLTAFGLDGFYAFGRAVIIPGHCLWSRSQDTVGTLEEQRISENHTSLQRRKQHRPFQKRSL
jgi:hypothetical protein